MVWTTKSLLGGTFMDITLLALDSALGLGIPHATAVLTAEICGLARYSDHSL